MAPRGKGGRRGVWVPPSKPRPSNSRKRPANESFQAFSTPLQKKKHTVSQFVDLPVRPGPKKLADEKKRENELQQQLASTQKDLESTRKNLASNVTLLEEANLVMANQSQRITELETKVGEMEEERSRFEAGMNDEGPTLGNLWWKATKDKDKAEKELEELKKKCREFFTACGYEGVE